MHIVDEERERERGKERSDLFIDVKNSLSKNKLNYVICMFVNLIAIFSFNFQVLIEFMKKMCITNGNLPSNVVSRSYFREYFIYNKIDLQTRRKCKFNGIHRVVPIEISKRNYLMEI